jgi:glucose/arabinose dehydrogenase
MLMSGFVVAVAMTVAIAVAFGGGGGAAAHNLAGTGERGTVRLELVGNFREPLYVAQPPGEDDRTFVVEKQGTIRIVEDGEKVRRPFLDLRSLVGSTGVEEGLYSIEFDPDFESSRWFYVAYTNKAGDVRVDAYRASPEDQNRAVRASRRVLLKIPEPDDTHKGGLLLFGPDEHLYIGSGDGGLVGDPTGMGLSRRVLLGKILRIDPEPEAPPGERPYGIPDDNPFRSGEAGRKPEIWAYGLRNPWRFSFDRQSGVMLIGDVGQDKWEEVDYVSPGTGAGSNFGWSAFEAAKRFKDDPRGKGSIKPILAYKHGPSCSVTGGYVSRDPDVPSLFGRYVYGDYCTGLIRSFIPTKLTAAGDRPLGLKVPALSSFGEDNAGHVYATSLMGPVYRLRAE